MSLRWKSELHLRLAPRQARVTLWPAGWSRRPVMARDAEGGPETVPALLDALSAEGRALPPRVRVVLDDDLLFHRLAPADGPWEAGREAAARALREATGEEDLVVGTVLTPCGSHWLATGMSAALLATLEAALAERGQALVAVDAALGEDLQALGDALPQDGLVVLPRTHAALVLRLVDGELHGLDLEPLEDASDADALAARVQAHLHRGGWAEGVTPQVHLLPVDGAQAGALAARAARAGWVMHPPALGATEAA